MYREALARITKLESSDDDLHKANDALEDQLSGVTHERDQLIAKLNRVEQAANTALQGAKAALNNEIGLIHTEIHRP
jgi:uncharacterized protein YoxC